MIILKNKFFFAVLYFLILTIDVVLKLHVNNDLFRLISKPLIVGSLLVFYFLNEQEFSRKKFYYMLIALSSFLVGDVFLIFRDHTIFLALGMFSFIIGKGFYAFRFSNQKDFELSRLLPVISFCFIYMFGIMNLIYGKLGDYFIPVLAYLFIAMIVVQFVYLRKGEVSYRSYILVFIGIMFSVLSDSIAVLSQFYSEGFFYDKITIIVSYSISQFFIVYGILEESHKKKSINI